MATLASHDTRARTAVPARAVVVALSSSIWGLQERCGSYQADFFSAHGYGAESGRGALSGLPGALNRAGIFAFSMHIIKLKSTWFCSLLRCSLAGFALWSDPSLQGLFCSWHQSHPRSHPAALRQLPDRSVCEDTPGLFPVWFLHPGERSAPISICSSGPSAALDAADHGAGFGAAWGLWVESSLAVSWFCFCLVQWFWPINISILYTAVTMSH